MESTQQTEIEIRNRWTESLIFEYSKVGNTILATVEAMDFDEDRWRECAPGIHFFIDRRAAVEYK